MPTLIQKQRELFDKTMHKYICSCVIDNIEKCPRTETVKHFLTTCLIEHYEEDIRKLEGKKDKRWIEHSKQCEEGTRPCGVWDFRNSLADRCREWKYDESTLDLAISLLQDKIKELKK